MIGGILTDEIDPSIWKDLMAYLDSLPTIPETEDVEDPEPFV